MRNTPAGVGLGEAKAVFDDFCSVVAHVASSSKPVAKPTSLPLGRSTVGAMSTVMDRVKRSGEFANNGTTPTTALVL